MPTPNNGIAQSCLALSCTALTKTYNDVTAISDVSLNIQKGQIVALLGPSGCGKTTLLRLIAGFASPDKGSIEIGESTVISKHINTPPEKRRVGMVFQEGSLFPHLTVEQNVAYGLTGSGRSSEKVHHLLNLVGLSELRKRMPHELSGGQQQRTALARALAPNPEVLLLDEPFSSLDPGLREQVRSDMLQIIKAAGVTAIFVTHDQEEALLIGDTVAVMNNGTIEQIGTPAEIFHSPNTKFTANFIGVADFIQGRYEHQQIISEIGSTPYKLEIAECDKVELMCRPDCLECEPTQNGQCTITAKEFRGAFYLYTVELPSKTTVRCLLSHTEDYMVGDSVEVTLRAGHELLPFRNGILASPKHTH